VELTAEADATETYSWLRAHHFHAFESTFSSFSAADILRLSRDDLIQICGLADGIRLFNALHARTPQPKLSLYFAMESGGGVGTTSGAKLWRAIYLKSLTSTSLTSKLIDTLGFSRDRLHSVLLLGPQGIHVLVTNELIANMKDESMFVVETIKGTFS
jgi:transcription factor CP2-like protein